jgi:capsular polysaccharide export protein
MRRDIARQYIERFHLDPKHLYAWGRKPSARAVERRALCTGQRVIRLEDGFLRSIGLGREEPPLSICIDPIGIYYDANEPSLLEELIRDS